MKIGFITTIDTNIGDDFIRTGIENIIESIKDPSEIKFTYVNKHKPETAILQNSPIHRLKRVRHFKGKNRLLRWYDKYLYHLFSVYRSQDLIIQSGAPVLWPNCQNNEWARPIWYKTIGRLKKKIPVINLAAGSCYPWEKQGDFHEPGEAVYAKDIGGFCKLTTTRDTLAKSLFESVNVKNTLMPCTAFFVDKGFEYTNEGKYILINYMEGGGHFDWGQHIVKEEWETTILSVIDHLKNNHEIRFICHSDSEVELANKIAPGFAVHYPKTVPEYLDCIKNAKLGINNRMHASVAMGSVGVPAISICTDTRLLMLDNIGMPIFYIKDVNGTNLLEKAQSLLSGFTAERKRLIKLKSEKFKEYQQLLAPFVTKK